MRIYTSRDKRYWCETTEEEGLYKVSAGHVTYTMYYPSSTEAVNAVKKARREDVAKAKKC